MNAKKKIAISKQQGCPEVKLDAVAIPSPRELIDHMDNFVVGQQHAKKVLAVAVSNHYKRIAHNAKSDFEFEIEKSNILLMGPTGCGKTLLAKVIAQKLHVPLAIADATTLTEAGYVGEDVENILLKLVQAADGDISFAEKGIIVIDEIDKIGKTSQNVSITRDVSGEGVQQALLKIIEGTTANLPPKGGRKHPDAEYIQLDTKNILFIGTGAFVHLDKIIKQRKNKSQIGFTNHVDSPHDDIVQSEDLVKYGMIPEFVGRMQVRSQLNELTIEDLKHILSKTKNCIINQYIQLFALSGATLKFTDSAITEIANKSEKEGTNARGLRSIVERTLLDLQVDLEPKEYVIDAKNVI